MVRTRSATVELWRRLVTSLLLSDHDVLAARPARVVDISPRR